ncbi:MAG: hypothetical protein RLZZ215_1055 [Pseudomonadota bacterium]|jgi:hypothetical protein
MSQQLISHNHDLARLLKDGYEVSIEYGHLILRNIPYVNKSRQICKGILISTLDLSGDKTNRPNTHVVMFSGNYPCDTEGKPLEKIRHQSSTMMVGEISVNHSFSSKPQSGYVDYHEKMTTYATLLSSHAEAIDPSVTARTGRIIEASDDSPFTYIDNASSRAGITSIAQKLKRNSVAIIGLGGTGSYILDFVTKTPVKQIHLYDADTFEQHNAFRTPGAASIEQLSARPSKVEYLASTYKQMHKGIVPHNIAIEPNNVELLRNHEFVFICIDNNAAKRPIIQALEQFNIPFIDVGMGLQVVDGFLIGALRTTTSTPQHRDHVHMRSRIPLASNDEGDNPYAQNIQIAELNALNACYAVIRWKKYWEFYKDTEQEHHSIFILDGNHLLNEDAA